MKTISVTKARANLYDLVEEVSKKMKRYGLTNRGETKVVLMSTKELDSLEETLDILSSNPNIVKELEEIEKDYKKGKYIGLEQLEVKTKRRRRDSLPTHV